jgi:hypothetical protein
MVTRARQLHRAVAIVCRHRRSAAGEHGVHEQPVLFAESQLLFQSQRAEILDGGFRFQA